MTAERPRTPEDSPTKQKSSRDASEVSWDLERAVSDAVQEGLREAGALETQVNAALAALTSAVDRMNRRHSGEEALKDFESVVASIQSQVVEEFERHRENLTYYNIVFFGRTGTGKSSLITAMGRLDGSWISPGKSDFTREVREASWKYCLLHDTPGIAGPDDDRRILEDRARAAVAMSDLVILCFDSQGAQYAEFQGIASAVAEFGKPVVAVFNHRTRNWRVPERVPEIADRRGIAEQVRQHRQTINDELDRIGLRDVTFIALNAQRASFARASEPYGGPHPGQRVAMLREFGADTLLTQANYPLLEELLATALTTGGRDLRLTSLREGVRRRLEAAAAELSRTNTESKPTLDALDRTVGETLRVLGYPEDDRRIALGISDGSFDQLRLLEEARGEPFTANITGELTSHINSLLRAHLVTERTRSIAKAETEIRKQFDKRKPISGEKFAARVLDEKKIEEARQRVWTAAGEYLERAIRISACEGEADIRAEQMHQTRINARAGQVKNVFGTALKVGTIGIGVGVFLTTLALFSNPVGWGVALVVVGAGIVSALMAWWGSKLFKKAEGERVEGRASALGDCRRNINEYFDNMEEQLAEAILDEAWERAGSGLLQGMATCTALHDLLHETQSLSIDLNEQALQVPASPSAALVMAKARSIVERRYPTSTDALSVWLGEDWLKISVERPGYSPTQYPFSSAASAASSRVSGDLNSALEASCAGLSVADISAWLEAVQEFEVVDVGSHGTAKHARRMIVRLKPKIAFVGDYSSGKTSIIRRILVDWGRPVPKSLVIRANPTTATVNEYPVGGLVLLDTPGLQSSNFDHDRRAYQAVWDSALVICVFHVNLLIGNPENLLRILTGGTTNPSKQRRVIYVINKADDIGVDPNYSYEDYDLRTRDKALELQGHLRQIGIGADLRSILTVASDPGGLTASRAKVRREDFDHSRDWDGMTALEDTVAAFVRTHDRELRAAATLDATLEVLMRRSAVLTEESDASAKELAAQRGLLRTVASSLADGETLQQEIRNDAEWLAHGHASQIVSEVLGASAENVEALGRHMAGRWQDPRFIADIEHFESKWVNQITRWYANTRSQIERSLKSRAFSKLQFDPAETNSATESAPRRSRIRWLSAVLGGAARLSEPVANREAVYAIGKAMNFKFKPWGAVKGGATLAKLGPVLAVVAVAVDGVTWIREKGAEKGRESTRKELSAKIHSEVPDVVKRILGEMDSDTATADHGERPFAYLIRELSTIESLRNELSIEVETIRLSREQAMSVIGTLDRLLTDGKRLQGAELTQEEAQA